MFSDVQEDILKELKKELNKLENKKLIQDAIYNITSFIIDPFKHKLNFAVIFIVAMFILIIILQIVNILLTIKTN